LSINEPRSPNLGSLLDDIDDSINSDDVSIPSAMNDEEFEEYMKIYGKFDPRKIHGN